MWSLYARGYTGTLELIPSIPFSAYFFSSLYLSNGQLSSEFPSATPRGFLWRSQVAEQVSFWTSCPSLYRPLKKFRYPYP